MRTLGAGDARTEPDHSAAAGKPHQRAPGVSCHRDAHEGACAHGADQEHRREPGEIKMRFSIDVGSELELKLYQAVLLYRNDHGNRHMPTARGVAQQNADGSPFLGAGQLLSTASLRDLARQLGTGCPVEFLPDQVIARTPDLLAWWMPAAVRAMFFRAGSELEGVSGKRFPHPALLFVVRNSILHARALSTNRRPGSDSKL